MKVNNQAVNKLGQEIAYQTLKKKGYRVIKGSLTLYIDAGLEQPSPVIIWTKTHQNRRILGVPAKITGKDTQLLKKLAKNPQTWVLWVDALLGQVLGGPLVEVMREGEFEGISYPHNEITHSGEITYFNIYKLPTVSEIEEDQLAQLRDLLFLNRSPKGQKVLF